MMTEFIQSSDGLFPYQHYTALLTALGNYGDGGRIALIDDARSIKLELDVPSVEFAVLVLLMQRALREPVEDHPGIGFYSKSQLLLGLKRLFLIDDPQTVPRTVFRLRERLRRAVQRKLGEEDAHAWSRSFIEHSFLGYRVSVPRENLRLVLLESD